MVRVSACEPAGGKVPARTRVVKYGKRAFKSKEQGREEEGRHCSQRWGGQAIEFSGKEDVGRKRDGSRQMWRWVRLSAPRSVFEKKNTSHIRKRANS